MQRESIITHCVYVLVALIIQQAQLMHRIILSSVVCLSEIIVYTVCFDFFVQFLFQIFLVFKQNSAYYDRCMCGLSAWAVFSTLSHTRYDFRKKQNCCLYSVFRFFHTIFVSNISRFKQNSAYYDKCT